MLYSSCSNKFVIKRKGERTMAKYENDVKQLLKLIGGKENIQAVSHCMTRMRFVLVDPKKADEKAIEEDRKSTRLNSSHVSISYAVFCLKKKRSDLIIDALYI